MNIDQFNIAVKLRGEIKSLAVGINVIEQALAERMICIPKPATTISIGSMNIDVPDHITDKILSLLNEEFLAEMNELEEKFKNL